MKYEFKSKSAFKAILANRTEANEDFIIKLVFDVIRHELYDAALFDISDKQAETLAGDLMFQTFRKFRHLDGTWFGDEEWEKIEEIIKGIRDMQNKTIQQYFFVAVAEIEDEPFTPSLVSDAFETSCIDQKLEAGLKKLLEEKYQVKI